MNNFRKSLVVFSTIAALVGCTANNGKKSNVKSGVITLNSTSIMNDSSLSSVEKAEKLALAGEQLVSLTGFMYADVVLDQALRYDPNNKRAQFYKAFLATPMALRGIMARIKPLATSTPDHRRQYEQSLKSIPNSGLKTFLLDGQPDIKTEKDIQGFFDQIYTVQDNYRNFLKNNKSLELTLNMPEWGIDHSYNKASESCLAEQISEYEYVVRDCDLTHIFEVKINRADIETLQQIAAGMQIYLATFVSYDATGAISADRKFKNKKVSNREIYKELAKNSDFGKLRNAQALQKITTLGSDLVAGLRYAVEIQNELCPNGEEQVGVREGHLFENSFCIHNENEDGTTLEDTLKVVEAVLAGQSLQITYGSNKENKTEIKPAAILQNPIADLKALRPVYNNCDKIQAVSDDTLGGLFPHNDANEVLSAEATCYNYFDGYGFGY